MADQALARVDLNQLEDNIRQMIQDFGELWIDEDEAKYIEMCQEIVDDSLPQVYEQIEKLEDATAENSTVINNNVINFQTKIQNSQAEFKEDVRAQYTELER